MDSAVGSFLGFPAWLADTETLIPRLFRLF
jgi:hypothetical protein